MCTRNLLHLPLWIIFRQIHINFINLCSAYASKICVQLTKNFLAKTSTKILRYYIQQELDKRSARMRSDSVKNMSAYADQNHAPSLAAARLEYSLKVELVEMSLESWREFD